MSKLAELEQKLQEITAEIEKLKNPNSRARSWDRVDKVDQYYTIGMNDVHVSTEESHHSDISRFKIANYNTDKSYMERIKFEQDLFRKLKRFADQNNVGEISWNTSSSKYSITCDRDNNTLECNYSNYYQEFGQVYFASREIAEKAIETFKTELLEYFGA